MLLQILLLPLLSSFTLGLFGRIIGRFGAMILSTFNMWVAALFSWALTLHLIYNHNFIYYNLGKWLSFMTMYAPSMEWIRWENWSFITVDWELTADSLTTIMLIVVTTVAALVHTFSIFYMGQDPYVVRFFTYLSMFAFFMLILVTANNFLVLFVGWEGVGIMSFALINFWFTRSLANKAAIKAIVVNRIGDVFLLTGLALIFSIARTLDFGIVFPIIDFALTSNEYTSSSFEWIGLCLLLAAVGKSAQLGRHTWLPDAMEGPTPVSALIHAATMVTAGIVLIIRSSNLFVNLPSVSALTALFGIATAFFAATAALVQYDMKKVIAYSTCSQRGYMLFAAGLQQYQASLFHLFNHAFFKALLFLAAGSVIHAVINEQDVRRVGGVGDILIFILMVTSIGTMALAGSTFLAGFYSKDIILESSMFSYTISGLFLFWIGTLTAVFTGIYSSDVLDDVFAEESNMNKLSTENVHASSVIEIVVLSFLGLLSIASGYVCRDIFVGLGSDFFGNALATNGQNVFTSAEFLPLTIKLLPTIFSLAVSFEIDRNEEQIFNFWSTLHFMSHKWYFDSVQNWTVVFPTFKLAYTSFWALDKYLLEMLRFKFDFKKILIMITPVAPAWERKVKIESRTYELTKSIEKQVNAESILRKLEAVHQSRRNYSAIMQKKLEIAEAKLSAHKTATELKLIQDVEIAEVTLARDNEINAMLKALQDENTLLKGNRGMCEKLWDAVSYVLSNWRDQLINTPRWRWVVYFLTAALIVLWINDKAKDISNTKVNVKK